MDTSASSTSARWWGAGWDVGAFVAGLGQAWYWRWEARDLVWSLWLSSLVVGYAMILWSLFAPAVVPSRKRQGDRPAIALASGVALLVFFTFHFGLFHFVHSIFLKTFFPIAPQGTEQELFAFYGEVVARYWWFVPVALVAERQAFRLAPLSPESPANSVAVTGTAARQQQQQELGFGRGLIRPYINVVRLHLLIFFFAAAHFARFDHFAVYAVVYAVYFFPWRRLFPDSAQSAAVP